MKTAEEIKEFVTINRERYIESCEDINLNKFGEGYKAAVIFMSNKILEFIDSEDKP